MNLSPNLTRLLHGAYPVTVLVVALVSWAGIVQGNENHISFQPQDFHIQFVSQSTSPRACSTDEGPFYLKRTDSCPEGEQDYSIAVQPERSERRLASEFGNFALKN
jgi:hypothetical protein